MVVRVTRKSDTALEGLLHLDDIGLGDEDRLLPLRAPGAAWPPHLGPLDAGRLVGWAGPQGEDAGQEGGASQRLLDPLVCDLTHVQHRVRSTQTCSSTHTETDGGGKGSVEGWDVLGQFGIEHVTAVTIHVLALAVTKKKQHND